MTTAAIRNSAYWRYADEVVNGSIVACQPVIQACRRFLGDLDRTDITFQPKLATRAIRFFDLLKHSKGQWGGSQFHLEPWQQFILANLFGFLRRDGSRRFRHGHIEVARKNGKTTFAAGIGLYLLLLDGEPGAEVYSCATKRDQARLSHKEAIAMVEASPALKARVGKTLDNLHVTATRSKFEPLGADYNTMDGLNPSGVLADELHAWPDRRLWDVMETATGARRSPLTIVTTTAGWNRHSIWYERRSLCLAVMAGQAVDDSLFAFVATLDDSDDWQDPEVYGKANPNLGVTVRREELIARRDEAIRTPGQMAAFRRLRLDTPTESASVWISLDEWDGCRGDRPDDELDGAECWGALDLSSTTDLTAFVLLFRVEGRYIVRAWYWIPGDTAQRRANEDRVPYPLWIDQGHIEATNGNAVDYDRVLASILDLAQRYRIREIAIDRWNATHMSTKLLAEGLEVVAFGQGYASMSAPAKEFERLILSREIEHNSNPVLRWNIGNCAPEQDAAGNLKPSKAKSTGRIDGVVATIMAIGRAMLVPASDTGDMTFEMW